MTADVEEPLVRACAQLARTMSSGGGLVDMVRSLAPEVAELLGVPRAAVTLVASDMRCRPLAAPSDPVGALIALEPEIREGPTLDAVCGGAVVAEEELPGSRWPSYVVRARALGVRSVLAIPLRGGDQSVGVLTVLVTERHGWHVREVAAVEVFADLVGAYAAQQNELDRLQRTTSQLQSALESRVAIEQAKGVLAGELGCSIEQAYEMLRDHARRNRATLQSVAHAVVHLGLRPPMSGRRSGVPPASGTVEEQRGSA